MRRRARRVLEAAAEKSGYNITQLFRAVDPHGFGDDLAGLAAEMVRDEDYTKAANLGRKAVERYAERPVDPNALGRAHAAARRTYAEAATERIALNVSDAVDAELARASDAGFDLEAAIARAGEAIDGQESAATRYGDAPWTAGQAAYGNQLGEFDVRFVWILDDDAAHCDDCPDLAEESAAEPWSIDTAPCWPGDGSTECLDRCKCHIQADDVSWAAAFPDADA